MNESSNVDLSSIDSSSVDSLTTDEQTIQYLHDIEYNTRITSTGINYLYILAILVLTFVSLWCIFKHWYFDGI